MLSEIDQLIAQMKRFAAKQLTKNTPINRSKIKIDKKDKKEEKRPQKRRHFLMANSVEIGRKTANKAV